MPEQLQQLISFLPALSGPLILILVFGLFYKIRNNRLPEEAGMTPIHQEFCGGNFNYTNLSRPFVRLTIYNDFLVISYFKQILLNYHEIEKVELKNKVGKKGLKIYHNKIGVPKNITLWSPNIEKIFSLIQPKLTNKYQTHNSTTTK
ncbi:hypothetical protein KJ641_02575 [Patescibacteria group bacterium]|nr:hypothetical protein [Patescibacteria group bacterium]MBU1895729.1 hypothetical protein [Patescibacteria group bacterium]